ncbi:DUF1109 domain-containing protein [Gemmobacter denitrificans]|uniref:DUF1109 domain-containing protein n=1 Tax=Gemmobacter denitrificans TaxID=3123040 RepID=A0ABU8BSL7_9RHOB
MTQGISTEDFIRQLAASPVPRPMHPALVMLGLLGPSMVALALYFWAYGLRPGLAEALMLPVVTAKLVLPMIVAALAFWLALVSARPGARPAMRWLILPLAIGSVLFAARAAQTAPGGLVSGMLGQTAAACLMSISAMSLGPTAAGILALRRGATTRPGMTGLLLGLASGAVVTAGYALHCPEDSPLFYVIWYGMAIFISGCIGAIAGRIWLRW